MPAWDTVSQVMTAPARLEEVNASLAIATKEEIGLERVETLGKETAFGQVTGKVVCFHLIIHSKWFPHQRVFDHTFECDFSG